MTRNDGEAAIVSGGRLRHLRRPLLSGCAMAALSIAAPSRAQVAAVGAAPSAVAAIPTGPAGSYLGTVDNAINAVVTVPSAGRTDIAIAAGKAGAIIDWTPNGPVSGNTIVFQQATTATGAPSTAIVHGDGTTAYTLLNRINGPTTLATVLNGVTTSYLGTEAAGVRGGAVWFYSPGGIIVGATGAFNVGSLLLTSNQLAFTTASDGTPNFFGTGPERKISVTGAPNSASSVVIQQGAQITLDQAGAYLAVISPHVDMSGTARVNGSVAYVAGEAADITMHTAGLFDIAVSRGSDAPSTTNNVVLSHTGSTTGPQPGGTPTGIYMVAVPKNDAITMLVTGKAGYDGQAVGASSENGIVVLVAGQRVETHAETGYGAAIDFFDTPEVSVKDASIRIQGGLFTSRVAGSATRDVTALGATSSVAGSNNLVFNGPTALAARHTVALSANGANGVTVRGPLTLTAAGAPAGSTPVDTTVSIDATNGGLFTADRSVTLNAATTTGSHALAHIGVTTNGRVTLSQDATLDASVSSDTRGTVRGGDVDLTVSSGAIDIGYGVYVTANGTAGAQGASATGGGIIFSATNGRITAGNTYLTATGAAGPGGAGTGGTIALNLFNTLSGLPAGVTRTMSLGALDATAYGYGGFGGGSGTGGAVAIALATGTTFTATSTSLLARGFGGAGADATNGGVGGTGGTGTGGSTEIYQVGGTTQFGDLLIDSNGFGGRGGDVETGYGATGGTGGVGGMGLGGSTRVTPVSGTLTASSLSADATGVGGRGGQAGSGTSGTGGLGRGGTTLVDVSATRGVLQVAGALEASANGQGGDGGEGGGFFGNGIPGAGGRGEGGTAQLVAEDSGRIVASDATVSANAAGGFDGSEGFGASGAFGTARGGLAEAIVRGGATATFDSLLAQADATFGGARVGGTANILVSGGTATIADALRAEASAAGGSSGSLPSSGPSANLVTPPAATGPYDATGGTATLTVDAGSTLTLGNNATVDVVADALSTSDGDFFSAPTLSGIAVGGSATATFNANQIIPNALNISAGGTSAAAARPGDAYGGTALLTVGGGTLRVNGLTNVTADARTGAGTLAANAYGGSATQSLTGGAFVGGAVVVAARGIGNDTTGANAASNGTGGDVALTIAGNATLDAATLSLLATGTGGADTTSQSGTFQLGAGGNGRGGTVRLIGTSGRLTVAGATRLDAGGIGGDTATSGTAGSATGGTVTLDSSGATSAVLALQSLDIVASGRGGQVTETGYGGGVNGGSGNDAAGGTINASIGANGLSATTIALNADGLASSGGSSANNSSGQFGAGNGGAAVGGTARLITGGALTASSVTVTAGAAGGSSGNTRTGAPGRAGDADASTSVAELGAVGTGSIAVPTVSLSANARVGAIGVSSTGVTSALNGGTGRAGTALLSGSATGTAGPVNVTMLTLSTLAQGGNANLSAGSTGAGGAATGGTAGIVGGAQFDIGQLRLDVRAIAGNSAASAGGTGTGGTARLAVTGGRLDLRQSLDLMLTGNGGGGTSGGAGKGADVDIRASGGAVVSIVPTLSLTSLGQGGSGGGAGTGGAMTLSANNGTINLTGGTGAVTLRSLGTGAGANGTAAGGAASGGAATVSASAGGTVNLAGGLSVQTTATGGIGGTGGAASAGAISLLADGGRIVTSGVGNVALSATASGGNARAGDAGAAQGGAVTIALASSGATLPASINATQLSITTNATGGAATATVTGQVNGRNGGAGTAGNVVIRSASGGLTATGATTINAVGQGGVGFGGAAGQAGTGGRGTGGAVSITTDPTAGGTAPAGTIDFAGVTINAGGFGGGLVEVGYGQPVEGGDGGAGQGGSVLVSSGVGRIVATSTTIDVQGRGANGQVGNGAAPGGDGGAGTGGSVTVRSDGGALTTGALAATLTGAGGAGATGASGGAGGAATGGALELAGNNGATPTIASVAANASAAAGAGAAGRTGAGGAGGAATGGTARFASSGTGGALTVPATLTINLGATAGNGGAGGNATVGGAGGAGGAATGGAITIAAANGGSVALPTAAGVTRTFTASATGGNGAAGGNGSNFGDAGGRGGDGGAGTGGTFTVTAAGGTASLGRTSVTLDGTGGNSATGGSGTRRPGVPGTPGDPTANPPVPPTAPIPEIPAVQAASGTAGAGTGGVFSVRASNVDGRPAGGIGFGTTTFAATGLGGNTPSGRSFDDRVGRIEILNDRTAADGGAITFGIFGATLNGFDQGRTALEIVAANGPVTFANFDATVGGGAVLRASGTSSIVSNGGFFLDASSYIDVVQGRVPGSTSDTLRAAGIALSSDGQITTAEGSIVHGLRSIDFESRYGSIQSAGALVARDSVTLTAAGDVAVADASADLAPSFDGGEGGDGEIQGGVVQISAGADTGGDVRFDATATITGRVFGAQSVSVVAGRDVVVTGTGTLESQNLVSVEAGDDIRIAQGGAINAATAPLFDEDPDFESSVGSAGAILIAGRLPVDYTPDDGNVASIIVDGSLSAGNRAISLTAGAVQADANPLVARSLIVSIDNAPRGGEARSDDGGQLRSDCRQGAVCLGTLQTSRTLLIGGLDGGEGIASDVRFTGGFSNEQSVIRSYGDIALGGGTTYEGRDLLRLTSIDGALTLGDGAVVTGGSETGAFGGLFDIITGTGVSGAGATLSAGNDARFRIAGGDLVIGTLSAGGVLTTLGPNDESANEVGTLRLPGAFSVTNLLSVRGGDAIVDAGGDIAIGTAEVADGSSIGLTAGGTLALAVARGADGGSLANLALQGTSVSFGDVRGTGNLTANATVGNITAGSADFGGDIALSAVGDIGASGPLSAGGDVDVEGGSATLRDVSSSNDGVYVDVTGAASLGNVTGDYIRIEAASIGAGNLVSRGDIALYAPGLIRATGADAGNDFYANAGSTDLGAVIARGLGFDGGESGGEQPGRDDRGDIVVDSTGAIRLASGNAAGLIRLTAQTGTISTGTLVAAETVDVDAVAGGATTGNVTGGGNVTLVAGASDLAGGAIVSGGAIRAAAGSTIGSLTSNGSITAASFRAATTVDLRATGAITAESVTAGGAFTAASGTTTSLGTVRAASAAINGAGGVTRLTDGSTTGDTIITSAAGATVGSVVSTQGSVNISTNGAIRAATLRAARDVTLAAANGDVLVSTNVAAGGLLTARGLNVTLNATDPLIVDSVAATAGNVLLNGPDVRVRTVSATGNFTVNASGLIALASDTTIGGGIALTAAQGITTRNLRAGLSIAANSTGSTVATNDIESVGGTVRVTAARAMTVANVRAAGSIFLTGAGAISSGDLTAGTGPLAAGGGATGSGGVDPTTSGIAAGFTAFSIPRCDDCFTSAVALPFAVNYFGNSYTSTYVSNNGYLTFNEGQGEFTPTGLGAAYRGDPIIAAFFADVDTRNPGSAQVTYGSGTYAGRDAFGATYQNVGYFSNQADKLNSFQIVLTNRADTGTGNFDIYYNYGAIKWETGSASSGVNGFGGISAGVGYNAGTGGQAGTFFELPGSRVPGSFLDTGPAALVTGTNNGVPGQLFFSVRNGQVTVGNAVEPPTIHVTNVATGNTADVTLGNLSAEAVEVHGAGAVRVGTVSTGDRGSGIAGTGNRYAAVLDSASGLTTGAIDAAGFVVLGANTGDIMAGQISTPSSVAVLGDGSIVLGSVTTGRGASDSLFVSGRSALTSPGFASFGFTSLLGSTRFAPTALAALSPTRGAGTLTIGGIASTGNFLAAARTINLGSFSIDAAGRIFLDSAASIASDTLTAGGDITLNSDGSVRVGRATSGRDITISAGTFATNGGGHDVTAANLNATRNVAVSADGAVALTGASAGGTLSAQATRDLTADGLTAAGALNLRSLASLAVGSAASTGGAATLTSGAPATGTVYALSGNTVVNGTVSGATGVTVNGGGSVTVNGALRSGGGIAIASGGNIAVAATGSVGAGTQTAPTVTLTAGSLRNGAATGPATIVANGTIGGGALTLASEAIDIGTAATIGGAGTTTLDFVNRGTARTFLGGAGDGSPYAISNAEFARTRAGLIRVTAPGTGADAANPDVVLQQIDLAGSAGTGTINLSGDAATFAVRTTGTLRVDGAVAITSAGANDLLSLSADRRIDVNATTGSLSVRNATGLGGRLLLASDTIFAGTPQAATDVAAASTTDARDMRLGQVESARTDGYLRANAIEFRFGSGLFVQNSGTSGDLGSEGRAGFAAGSGGVTLTATGAATANPVVIVNGRITGSTGTVTTGAGVIPLLVIRGASTQTTTQPSLDPRSTANGCLIVGRSCRFDAVVTPPVPLVPPAIFPVQDTIQEALDPDDDQRDPTAGGITRVNAPLIDLPEFTGYGIADTIDEPVTGAGNDDLLLGQPDDCPPGAADPRCTGNTLPPTP